MGRDCLGHCKSKNKNNPDYKPLYKMHLMPVIGSMPINEIDVGILEKK